MSQAQVKYQQDNIYAHALNRRYSKGASSKMSKKVQEAENTMVTEQRRACEQREIEGAKRQVRDHIILAVLLKRGPQTVEALSKNTLINSRSIQTSLLRLDRAGHIAWDKPIVSLLDLPAFFSEYSDNPDSASVSEGDLVAGILFRYALKFPGVENGATLGPRDTFSGVLAPTTQHAWCTLACPKLKEHGLIDVVHPSVHTETCRCANRRGSAGGAPGVSA